jgi:uncharacterized OB-fold protein
LPHSDLLSQPFELGFTYTRSTGPVVGRFLGALKCRRLLGNRLSDGRVIVPPVEFDPITAEPLEEWVELGQGGVIVSWCWVSQPHRYHPSQTPFAWAMIRLDGADLPLMHWVAATGPEALRTGARVVARWRAEPQGHITDLCGFELVPDDER